MERADTNKVKKRLFIDWQPCVDAASLAERESRCQAWAFERKPAAYAFEYPTIRANHEQPAIKTQRHEARTASVSSCGKYGLADVQPCGAALLIS